MQLNEEMNATLNMTEMVERYARPVYFYIRKLVIVHDEADKALFDFFKSLHTNPEILTNESEPVAIYRLATESALDTLKENKIKYLLSFKSVESALSDFLNTDPFFIANAEKTSALKQLIKRPEVERVAFLLSLMPKLTTQDIADIILEDVEKVDQRLNRLSTLITNRSIVDDMDCWFKTPKNYFEELPARIQYELDAYDKQSNKSEAFAKIKPYLALMGIMLLFSLIAFFFATLKPVKSNVKPGISIEAPKK